MIGYDQSEQLDLEPARYFVLVTKREKRACPFCQEGGIATAPLATRIIDKGLASDRVVIDAVVAKYSSDLPLYRQSAILERETGLEISRATLDGWIMRLGEFVILENSVYERIKRKRRTFALDVSSVLTLMRTGEVPELSRACILRST